MLKNIRQIFTIIFEFLFHKILKPLWKHLKKIKLGPILLLISLIINLCLVWFGALGLEYSNRAVIYTPKAITYFPHQFHFNNSGRSESNLRAYAVAVRAEIQPNKELKLLNQYMSDIFHFNLYPSQNTSMTCRDIDILFSYPPPENQKYLAKLTWHYNSLFPDIIPGISSYSDSLFYDYDKIDKIWKVTLEANYRELLNVVSKKQIEIIKE